MCPHEIKYFLPQSEPPSGSTETYLNLEILSCDPLICTNNHPRLIVPRVVPCFGHGDIMYRTLCYPAFSQMTMMSVKLPFTRHESFISSSVSNSLVTLILSNSIPTFQVQSIPSLDLFVDSGKFS